MFVRSFVRSFVRLFVGCGVVLVGWLGWVRSCSSFVRSFVVRWLFVVRSRLSSSSLLVVGCWLLLVACAFRVVFMLVVRSLVCSFVRSRCLSCWVFARVVLIWLFICCWLVWWLLSVVVCGSLACSHVLHACRQSSTLTGCTDCLHWLTTLTTLTAGLSLRSICQYACL